MALSSRLARRPATLQAIIRCLARQIADGSTPIVDHMDAAPHGIDLAEMRRLADLCDARQLPAEAARIRRWLRG